VITEDQLVRFLIGFGAEQSAKQGGGHGGVKQGELGAIKTMIETSRVLLNHHATPKFFQALSDFEDQYPKLCNTITAIDIRLESKFPEAELSFVEGVLNELFLRAPRLEWLTLRHFPPRGILGSLATIDKHEALVVVDLQSNSLYDNMFVLILRCLPKVHLTLDVTNNDIKCTDELAFFLSKFPQVRSLCILEQSYGKFPEDKFRERQRYYQERYSFDPNASDADSDADDDNIIWEGELL